jgi:hypothetical protein
LERLFIGSPMIFPRGHRSPSKGQPESALLAGV